jgi:hypothetical protein
MMSSEWIDQTGWAPVFMLLEKNVLQFLNNGCLWTKLSIENAFNFDYCILLGFSWVAVPGLRGSKNLYSEHRQRSMAITGLSAGIAWVCSIALKRTRS